MSWAFARVLAITLLLQIAVYGMRPMVSYEAISFGAGTFELGVIASAFAILRSRWQSPSAAGWIAGEKPGSS
jgi:hypothetical protein